VLLTWVNPTIADFAGTMIRYRTDAFPTSPTDGTLLCDRSAARAPATRLPTRRPPGGLLYAFAYDTWHNYAGGVQKMASTTWLDDPFDSYNDGGLDGQGGWTKDASTNSCIVQAPSTPARRASRWNSSAPASMTERRWPTSGRSRVDITRSVST